MITEDYVSLETAKLLKEKGFDENCDRSYVGDDAEELSWSRGANNSYYKEFYKDISLYSAPRISFVMKWLREVHDMYIKVSPYINDSYNFYCDVYTKGSESWDNQNVELGDFPTYEQAAEAAIKYCLNLI